MASAGSDGLIYELLAVLRPLNPSLSAALEEEGGDGFSSEQRDSLKRLLSDHKARLKQTADLEEQQALEYEQEGMHNKYSRRMDMGLHYAWGSIFSPFPPPSADEADPWSSHPVV